MIDVIRPFAITAIVLVEVGLWQWRIALTGRGRKIPGALLGSVGASLQVTAISQVVADMDQPVTMLAYAIGVGAGVLAGCCLDERLSKARTREPETA